MTTGRIANPLQYSQSGKGSRYVVDRDALMQLLDDVRFGLMTAAHMLDVDGCQYIARQLRALEARTMTAYYDAKCLPKPRRRL